MSIPKESISDAAMADCILPTDVMLSILTRLPAKSIQRFKFVSKLWRELFSSPEFIKMYKGQFSIDPNNQSVIIFEYVKRVVNLINIDSNESPKKPYILDLPHFEIPENRKINVGCCNGLVCVVEEELGFILLWNPAMEMFQPVKLSEDAEGYKDDGYKDDGYFVVSVGLGYDAGGDDFKLVRIVSEVDDNDGGVYLAEVYSVNSDAWTTIDVNLKFGVHSPYSVVTLNGNPYWRASYYDYEEEEGDVVVYEENVLVYFDVKLLVFKIVPLPPPHQPYRGKVGKVVDWNGTLGYLEYAHNEEKTESYFKVWVFEDNWRCKETLGPIKGTRNHFVICSWNGNILGCKDNKCFLYDPKSNCIEEIMNMGHYYFDICGYTANFERTLKKSLSQNLNAD